MEIGTLIIIAHSPWLCLDGEQEIADFLDSVFDWLEPQPYVIETVLTATRFSILLLIILPVNALIVLLADLIYPKLIKKNESK